MPGLEVNVWMLACRSFFGRIQGMRDSDVVQQPCDGFHFATREPRRMLETDSQTGQSLWCGLKVSF